MAENKDLLLAEDESEKFLSSFYDDAQNKIKEIKEKVEKIDKDYEEVAKFYGENPQKFTMIQFVDTFRKFTKDLSDALSSVNLEFALILLERFSSISLNKLRKKNEKGQNLLHILCSSNADYNFVKNDDTIKKIFNILTEKIKINKNEFDKSMIPRVS